MCPEGSEGQNKLERGEGGGKLDDEPMYHDCGRTGKTKGGTGLGGMTERVT
jgi:hypothetical protein